MSEINKPLSDRDYSQVIQRVSNDLDASLTISGFVTSKVGNKILQEITTTNVPNDTEIFIYKSESIVLYELTIIYTDGTREQMISVERTA